jgi:hypothetical protein
MSDADFEHEPVPGLPELLPAGERTLWQGRPRPLSLAIEALRLKWIAGYFALIAVWQAGSAVQDGDGWREVTALVVWTILLAMAALGTLTTFGWGIARSTIYTVTNRRLVIRHGLAIPMTVNIPFTSIATADVRMARNGAGDVVFKTAAGRKANFFSLWPHARPWRFSEPQPMFRSISDVERVAKIVAHALAASASQQRQVLRVKGPARQEASSTIVAANGLAVPS